jgi:hypothetical protein
VIEIATFVFLPLHHSLPPFICIADAGKRGFGRDKICDAIKGAEAVSTARKYDIICPLNKTMEIFILGNSTGG